MRGLEASSEAHTSADVLLPLGCSSPHLRRCARSSRRVLIVSAGARSVVDWAGVGGLEVPPDQQEAQWRQWLHLGFAYHRHLGALG